MRKSLVLFIFLLSNLIFGQTEPPKASLIQGEIKSLREADSVIGLLAKDGEIQVIFSPKTIFKKVLPENPSPVAAVASSLSEIGIGDKILISAFLSADKTKATARTIYLMTKADISKKNQTEQEKWNKSITGKIVLVNESVKEVTVAIKTPTGDKNVILSTFSDTIFRRYSDESTNYKDAKIGSFNELKIGDQIRAVGEINADGSIVKAGEIISGSFKQVWGKIVAINLVTSEITLQAASEKQGKTTIIALKNSSILKKYPEELAQITMMKMMSNAMGGGNATVRPPTQQGSSTPQPPKPTTGNPPTPASNTTVQIDENTFDKFQPITLAELKVGDTIAMLCPNKEGLEKLTAIRLLSGMDFLNTIPQMANVSGRIGGGSPSLSIPGLDGGFGTP
jgi:molybdenum-dependent DNA-binding transcriptional regulator ModE